MKIWRANFDAAHTFEKVSKRAKKGLDTLKLLTKVDHTSHTQKVKKMSFKKVKKDRPKYYVHSGKVYRDSSMARAMQKLEASYEDVRVVYTPEDAFGISEMSYEELNNFKDLDLLFDLIEEDKHTDRGVEVLKKVMIESLPLIDSTELEFLDSRMIAKRYIRDCVTRRMTRKEIEDSDESNWGISSSVGAIERVMQAFAHASRVAAGEKSYGELRIQLAEKILIDDLESYGFRVKEIDGQQFIFEAVSEDGETMIIIEKDRVTVNKKTGCWTFKNRDHEDYRKINMTAAANDLMSVPEFLCKLDQGVNMYDTVCKLTRAA